jgi:hypothetical protein
MLRIILKTSTTLLLLAVIPHGQHHGLAASICFLAAIDPIDGGLITLTIQAFGRAAGTGLTKTYPLINLGVLETVVVGKRRLIVIDSYRRFIAIANPIRDALAGIGAEVNETPITPRRVLTAIKAARDAAVSS